MRQIFYTIFLLMIVTACTTGEKQRSEEKYGRLPEEFPRPPSKKEAAKKSMGPVNVVGLQARLGMNRAHHVLGYREKSFNTCEVGNGYPESDDCQNESLVVIHIQMMCRDSDDTVSEVVTEANLTAIANQNLKWNLGKLSGLTKTDREGFAQIRTVASGSQIDSRLRVTMDSDFLFLRAGEVNRVIAPKQWCR